MNIGINDNNTKIDSDNSIIKILFTFNYNINYNNNNDIMIIHNNIKIILVEYFEIRIL